MTATTDRAKEAAGEARGEASTVAHEARDQVAHVAHEAQEGMRDVVDEARHVVHDEADRQTHSVAESMHRLAGDLRAMADRSESDGVASDYVGRIGRTLDDVAQRLDDDGVDGALDEMRRFARRHPGMFLAGSAFGGFALARVMRHANAPGSSSPQRSDGGSIGTPQLQGEGQLTEYGRSQMRGQGQDSGGRREDIDLRDDYERRPADAPQLRDDMQEWVRP
ncbi:hypothetical protein [Actinomarinicola tropica]|uniref:DUF3618 domain-containing protein n=1 Tax=Actinomarinicola tropica TaxID=2789776 RepID=A0A5Q2RLW8_9ACTN|nr:hypothetical protein [Actinomarinicola tropica]QGG95077.1 hypothetical protein GH723_08140 [Actinomarinicola tropica]